MKTIFGKLWYFIWEDNSLLSWIINAILAFILIKFLVYPGLGFAFNTESPVVAVISGSMEHGGQDYDVWWDSKSAEYEPFNITKSAFARFPFRDGMNKGDMILLRGTPPSELKVGEIIVFRGENQDPIIHRIVSKRVQEEKNIFSSKGDRNSKQIEYEKNIDEDRIVGKAVFRIPFLGYIKIGYNSLVNLIVNRG